MRKLDAMDIGLIVVLVALGVAWLASDTILKQIEATIVACLATLIWLGFQVRP